MLYLKNGTPQNNVPIQDRAFQYGDGCFTTAKISNNKILLWPRHQKRLIENTQQLMLQPDWSCLDELILKIQSFTGIVVLNGTLKIIISRGEGQRGYGFIQGQLADCYILFYPDKVVTTLFKSPSYIKANILQSQIASYTMPQLLGVKSLNRLEQVILKHEASLQSIAEGLVLDTSKQVVEGISSNCFIYSKGCWMTPLLNHNGIKGVMRAEILERMQINHVICQEMMILEHDLEHIESLFFCNALNPMQIVNQLGSKQLNTEHPQHLFQLLALDRLA